MESVHVDSSVTSIALSLDAMTLIAVFLLTTDHRPLNPICHFFVLVPSSYPWYLSLSLDARPPSLRFLDRAPLDSVKWDTGSGMWPRGRESGGTSGEIASLRPITTSHLPYLNWLGVQLPQIFDPSVIRSICPSLRPFPPFPPSPPFPSPRLPASSPHP